jgi:hypothetical protein
MVDQSPFQAVAHDLLQTIEAALPKLRAISEPDAERPRAAGKWSRKQIVGHLIDSAANNHHRFVRAQEGPMLSFPPYAQDHWVSSQHYQDRSWNDLVTLWHAYNRHLTHVIGRIAEDRRHVPCTIETNEPVTLEFLASDYVEHLRHHLGQIGVLS